MDQHSLRLLSDPALRAEVASLVASDCRTTAQLLAHLAEFERRKLHVIDGYSSMFTYCVQKLRFSEDMAFKRIRVARAARRHPSILEAIEGGRLHLTGAVYLAPHLTPDNADELIEAATHKTKAEIELMIAQHFPRPDVPALVRKLPAPAPQVTARIVQEAVTAFESSGAEASTSRSEVVPEPPRPAPGPARIAPLASRRFAFQTTIDQGTLDKLHRIQELLGHQVHRRDFESILDRAFDALLAKLERAKFAATDRPRPAKDSAKGRHIPAKIKRAVWQRDRGQCTFVSDTGHDCAERTGLEYDHIVPVARGGEATIVNLRLRCPAHNQHEAERAFGAEFMEAKRRERRQI